MARTIREMLEDQEAQTLHPRAAFSARSSGRVHPDPEDDMRPAFQRDRDRLLHCKSFRRLKGKTQVFLAPRGDHYRNRLTHTIEVAQIARSVARALSLNEPLAEAICLAHDLGHTPFGHAGQDALNACMQPFGGFEHNLQSIRVVDELEERYAEFPGLNLCFETREGIVKHCSLENARLLGELGERFLDRTQPSLEAQICNFADEIAYLCAQASRYFSRPVTPSDVVWSYSGVRPLVDDGQIIVLGGLIVAILPVGLGLFVWAPVLLATAYTSYRAVFTEPDDAEA